MRNQFNTMNRVNPLTPWYRRLMALAEIRGHRSQQDVAHALGVSKSAVTNWKNGVRPDPEQVKEAARVYDVDALELLRIAYLDEDEEPKPKKRRPGPNRNGPPL